MNAGKLRHKIALLKKETITNPSGYSSESWQIVAEVWAMIEGLKGKEYFAAAAINAQSQVRMTIRYKIGINADMRIRHNTTEYEIRSIADQDGRKRYLQIMGEVINSG